MLKLFFFNYEAPGIRYASEIIKCYLIISSFFFITFKIIIIFKHYVFITYSSKLFYSDSKHFSSSIAYVNGIIVFDYVVLMILRRISNNVRHL